MSQIQFITQKTGLFPIAYCLFSLFFLANYLHAQTAEKIYRNTQVPRENEYYIEQAKLWKEVLKKSPKDADAWFNYYRANRYMHITSGADTTFSPNRFQRLTAIEKEAEKNIPNTFEANYIKWANGGNEAELFPYLEKAYQIAPQRVETYDSFIAYYELQGDIEKRDIFIKKWYESGDVSPGMLNYSYNVLMSLKPNAILITNGDNDTYPIWILQAVKGIRNDVKALNYSLLHEKNYRERVCKAYNIQLIDPLESQESEQNFLKSFIPELAANAQKYPIYTANTCNPKIIQSVEKDLYLVGLAYLYQTEKFDNIAVLKKNLEKEFALDYLKVNFVKDGSAPAVAHINTNYVVPILSLYEHYHLGEENEKAIEWKNLVIKIAKGTEVETKVNEYFKEK